jgi:branched-chain amino acid transport system ATP-binding protein
VPENRRIATDPSVLENLETGRRRPGEAPDAAPVPAWTSERLFASFPTWMAPLVVEQTRWPA